MSATFTEFRYYSPTLDQNMVRISMSDSHSREFYVPIPESDGKGYRARRDAALAAIQEAIEAGLQPGRVHVR